MFKTVFVPFASTINDRNVNKTVEYFYMLVKSYVEHRLPLINTPEQLEKHSEILNSCHTIIALACTGGVSKLITYLAKYHKPIIVLSHPTQNSLASAIHACNILKHDKYPILILHNLSKENISDLEKALKITTGFGKMVGSKLLLIGVTKDWVLSEQYDIQYLEKQFKIKVLTVSLEDLVKTYKTSEAHRELIQHFEKFDQGEKFSSLIHESSKVYSAIISLLKQHNAIGYGIRCFPFIMRSRTTPCLAVSYSIDNGIVGACEADLGALITMLIAHNITGEPVFMGNIENIRDNNIVLAHCTIATKLLSTLSLRSHFETNSSVAIAGEIKEEFVTLLRLSNDFRKIFVAEGKILRNKPWSNEFCRTQLEIRVNRPLDKLIKNPIGSHLVVVPGNHFMTFQRLAEILNIVIY
mgnify:CR=1 FL=1